MDRDPLIRQAMQRIIRLSAEIEAALIHRDGGNIVIEITRRLRERSAKAMVKLATVDPRDTAAVIKAQDDVQYYDEWMTLLRGIIEEGVQYDRALNEEDATDIIDLLSQTPDGQQQLLTLGIVNDGTVD